MSRSMFVVTLVFLNSEILSLSVADAQVIRTDNVEGGVLDQQFVEDFTEPRYNNSTSYGPINEYQEYAQSFTVGISGYLSHVQVYGSAPWWDYVTLSVWDMANSTPTEVLATRTLQPGGPSSLRWITFDVRPFEVRLRRSEMFAISLSGKFSWVASQWQNPYLTYDGGGVFNRILMSPSGPPYNEGNWYRFEGSLAENDLLFRTFVNPIPETSSIGLLISGILLLPRRRLNRGRTTRHDGSRLVH